MYKNYLRTALRNLWRNKTFSLINIIGLSVGLAACMLIFLYAKDELSFDRFHKNRDRIFHITADFTSPDGHVDRETNTGSVQGPNFKRLIPEIEDFVRVQSTRFTLKRGNEVFSQDAFYADSSFFSIFSFPLVKGDPASALRDPHSVVLSGKTATKYFGKADPVGQVLDLKINDTFRPFTVTGVMTDAPINSSIQPIMIVPYTFRESIDKDDEWLNFYLNTFITLARGADTSVVLRKMQQVYHDEAAKQIQEAAATFGFKQKISYGLQPLLSMHTSVDYPPNNGLSKASKPLYSYILSAIALFILLIACINFINLTIARSLKRAKEIGIRKVVGGQRRQLIVQFLGESFILETVAFLLAVLIVELVLPFFNTVANKALAFSYLLDIRMVAGYIGIFLVTGLLAGFYPALVLSGFRPVQTLYGRQQLGGKNLLARGLVVLQFTLATFLIIAAIIIYAQFDYLVHYDLGYNDKNVLVINGNVDDAKRGVFNTTVMGFPGVVAVTADQGGRWTTIAHVNGGQEINFDIRHIDEAYLSLFQVPVVSGRNFSKDTPSDSATNVLVNESFVKTAGWKKPLGETVDFFYNQKKYTVIGVVKDYHSLSLAEKIPATLYSMNPKYTYSDIFVRLKGPETPAALDFIQKTYKSLFPLIPYSYSFKADDNREQYDSEQKWKMIVTAGALITIFVSCIGLFGLATLSAEKRKKEIGIRKVLGASVRLIVARLSGDFVRLVLIAALIACPCAWWATHSWLNNYPYHVEIRIWIFFLAVFMVLLIALATISFQSIRAAIANPVDSLRVE